MYVLESMGECNGGHAEHQMLPCSQGAFETSHAGQQKWTERTISFHGQIKLKINEAMLTQLSR